MTQVYHVKIEIKTNIVLKYVMCMTQVYHVNIELKTNIVLKYVM